MARKTAPDLKIITASSRSDAVPMPPHLGADGQALWQGIMAQYAITDVGGQALLQQAAEAADRIAAVRARIDEEGEMLTIRGIPRVHPLCAVERDQRAALVRTLKALNLDLEPVRDGPGRPAGMQWGNRPKPR